MTIRRFTQWGRLIDRPQVIQVCESDAHVARIASDYRSRGERIPYIQVTGGSLATSLGGSETLLSTEVRELPVDLLQVTYRTDSGIEHVVTAANSVVMRHRLWMGEIVAVTNSGYWRSWDIAPRAHPNDGVFDVVEVDPRMSWRQRLIARRRLPLGTQIPHPLVSIRRSDSELWTFAGPIGLYIDDEYVEHAISVQIVIEVDALNLVI